MPIAAVVTATLILSVSFLIFSSSLVSYPSIPPIITVNSSTSTNLQWKFTPNGSIYDPPVIAGDYIYVQSFNRDPGLRYVYCLNSSNGNPIWSHTTDAAAIIDGKNVYVKNIIESTNSHNNIVYALDAITGLQKWNYTSANASSGTELWNYQVPEYVESINVADGYAIVSFTNVTLHGDLTGSIIALNAVTGTKIWNYTIQGDSINNLDIDRLLYIGTSGASLYVLDPSNGQKVGNFTTESFGAVPIVYGNLVYARADDSLFALDASTLAIKWNITYQNPVGTIVPSSPSVFFSVDKTVYSLDASSGAQRWTFESKENSFYTVAGNRAYIASFYPTNFTFPFLVPSIYNTVYELDALSGEKLWNYTVEGNIMSLTATGNVIYVGTAFATTESQTPDGNGTFYALKTPEVSLGQPPQAFPFSLWLIILMVVLAISIPLLLYLVWHNKRRLQPLQYNLSTTQLFWEV